jgi:hypothetical protein
MAQVVEVMQWAVIKITLKKAWVWLKTYWQVPFLLAWTLVIYLFARRNTDALLQVLEIKKQSHKEEVEALNKSHKDEILKLKGIQAEYLKTIEQLESKFEEQQRKLSEKQVEHVKEVVIKSKGNPEEIKRKIENEFGIKFKN